MKWPYVECPTIPAMHDVQSGVTYSGNPPASRYLPAGDNVHKGVRIVPHPFAFVSMEHVGNDGEEYGFPSATG